MAQQDGAQITSPTLTDDDILEIAKGVPHARFNDLGVKLGLTLTEVENIKQKHHSDINQASVEALVVWRNAHGEGPEQKEKLRSILDSANLGHLGFVIGSSVSAPPTQPSVLQDFLSKQISKDVTVRQCRKTLIEHYLQSATIQLKPWDKTSFAHLADLYTKIAVTQIMRGHRGGRDDVRVPVEGSVNGIFSTVLESRRPMRILLLGGAGYGKTTIITKIVHDWTTHAEGCPIRDVPLLFALKLRETDDKTILGSAIRAQLLGNEYPVPAEELEKFITENDHECCILLDEYDGFPGSIVGKGPTTSLVQLMRCQQFSGCLVLVTSRPQRQEDFDTGNLPNIYARIDIEGYSAEDAERYIMRFFRDTPLRGQELITQAKDHHAFLDSLLRIPFFCMAVCCMWEGDFLKKSSTLTEIFNCILSYLVQHAKSKVDPIHAAMAFSSENLKPVFNVIGKVAFESLRKDSKKPIFLQEHLEQYSGELDTAVAIGLLCKQDIVQDPVELFENPKQTRVEFYHTLVREHCAGMYLSSLTSDKLKRELLQLASRERVVDLEHVLMFAVGLSANHTPFFEHVVGVKWPDDTFMKRESDSYSILLNMMAESKSCDEQLLATCLLSHFAKGSLNLHRLRAGMIQGLEKVPAAIKTMITTVHISDSELGSELTSQLWHNMTSLTSLTNLEIWDSSLPVPSKSPNLPSVRKVGVVHLNSDDYFGVVGSLSRLSQIDVTLSHPAFDTSELARGLSRVGRGVTQIGLSCGWSADHRSVPANTMKRLCDVVRTTATNLEEIRVQFLTIEEGSLLQLVEACRATTTMKKISIERCGSRIGGEFESHLASLHQLQGAIRVHVDYPVTRRYLIPHSISDLATSWSPATIRRMSGPLVLDAIDSGRPRRLTKSLIWK